MASLPLDFFYEVALRLPHTNHILSLALTNHTLCAILLTSALFKARLSLQGWDLSAWHDDEDETAGAQLSRNWKDWMRIDYAYSRTLQLFDELAAVDNNVVYLKEDSQLPVLNVEKMKVWLRKSSVVFPMFVTHLRGEENFSRITDPKYHKLLWAFTWTVADLCCSITAPHTSLSYKLSSCQFGWFERACFSLIALLMQCNKNVIKSIFNETWKTFYSPVYFQTVWKAARHASAGGFRDLFSISFSMNSWSERERLSQCYSTCFTVQTKMHLELILNSAGDGPFHRDRDNKKHLSLRAPSFRSIDPASRYDLAFGLAPVYPFPWLQNGLAGTPSLFYPSSDPDSTTSSSTTSSRPWAGYYTTMDTTVLAPPIFFVLRPWKPPVAALPKPNRLYFEGEGHDYVGLFSLRGWCHIPTGTIEAIKTSGVHPMVPLHWSGMLTPFGMVGVREDMEYRGWWWVWPEEWSSDAE